MKERKDWQEYVTLISSKMGLGHWRVKVSDESTKSENSMATFTPWTNRHAATIRLSDAFLKEESEEQRYIVVHELLHCHLAHMDSLIEGDLSTDAGAAYTVANEYAVDAIASVIAGFMPLPSEEP